MANFYINDTTAAGERLLADAFIGNGTIETTRMAVGSGSMPPGATASGMTKLVIEEATFFINKKKRLPDGANALIGGAFKNDAVENGFTMREIGMFAKVVYMDGTESEEVLYSYGNAGDQGDYIPAYSTGTVVDRQINIIAYIGSEATVNLTVDSEVSVSMEEFEELQASLDAAKEHLANTDRQHAADKEELLAAINSKPGADHKHSTDDLTIGVLDYARGGTGMSSREALMHDIANTIYPIGSIYMSVKNVNPASLFGGTWVAWGSGRVPVGVDTSQTEFNTVEKAGGAKTHALTAAQMPSHNHSYIYVDSSVPVKKSSELVTSPVLPWNTGKGKATSNAGSNQAHNNLQPYITCYMWKRTA